MTWFTEGYCTIVSHFPIWCPNSRPSVNFCVIRYPAFITKQNQRILTYTFILSKINGDPHYIFFSDRVVHYAVDTPIITKFLLGGGMV